MRAGDLAATAAQGQGPLGIGELDAPGRADGDEGDGVGGAAMVTITLGGLMLTTVTPDGSDGTTGTVCRPGPSPETSQPDRDGGGAEAVEVAGGAVDREQDAADREGVGQCRVLTVETQAGGEGSRLGDRLDVTR